ncbi:leucine-rich repeat domain-containing protein [uncultured Pontibacter sp.]|uniref:leucine-rich repeat domain-containing protein n=1 Tax=uncultured Pontibacter sp. TaxID=453356 RepID=UPI00261B5A20|nr:leucine-rich repeat domain-containing protein [uncultured Pontibacter sp.]
MKRLVNSPLKVIGLLTVILGLLGVLTFSHFFFVGIYLIGIGLLIYLVDYLILKLIRNKRVYSAIQAILTTAYLVLAFVTYMSWQEHNYIVFQKEFKGQAGIIFGIEGYPELPETKFWKKTIEIPDNGIIITSTKVEDIPSTIRFAFTDNSIVDYRNIDWEPNFEIDCILNDSKVKSWLFQVKGEESTAVKEVMTSLCNEISSNTKKSVYKSEYSPIVADSRGKYLWLQSKDLISLPDGLGSLGIYRAILTGNGFNDIPEQIFEIGTLEDLIMAVNPISEFPCNLTRLKRLKSVSFAATRIKEIKCDLSQLDSLEHFDLARNELTAFPNQLKTLPNITWLSLNDNQFTDFSFIDERLDKLETLDLYSNKISSISSETEHLGNLKEFLIFDNEIDSIPDNISDLKNLEKLEIWNNPIKYISPKIAELTKLKTMRIDDDNLTQVDKENLKKWLPNCNISYQTRSEKEVTL